MEQRKDCYEKRMFVNYEMALRGLDKASEIAIKLGIYPDEVLRMKEMEMKELKQHFLNR